MGTVVALLTTVGDSQAGKRPSHHRTAKQCMQVKRKLSNVCLSVIHAHHTTGGFKLHLV
jgi:hypothetical protein